MNSLENELNHEEPPWRTPVNKKDNEIELKDEKNKIKACDDLDGGSDEMVEEIWAPGKKRWKHFEPRMWYDEPPE